MKKHFKQVLYLSMAITAVLCFSSAVSAEVEWNTLKDIELKETPLDIAVSRDGLTAYILCEKSIQLYSLMEGRVTDTIPVIGSFSQIALSPDGETLLLTDAKNKQLSVIRVTPVYHMDIGLSPVMGKADAPVTIFAFMDYQWPYCSRIHPVLEQLLEKYPDQVNLVLKHYPLGMHKAARPAALAALAAEKQGKYKEISTVLFTNYKTLTPASIKQYAQQVGLDMAAYEKDVQSPQIQKIVAQDAGDARKFKVRGVPAIFINGRAAKSRSLEGFEQIIKKELEKAR